MSVSDSQSKESVMYAVYVPAATFKTVSLTCTESRNILYGSKPNDESISKTMLADGSP